MAGSRGTGQDTRGTPMNHPSSMMASDPIRSHARPVCVYDREAAQQQIARSMWTTSIHRVRRSRTTAVGWVAVAQPRQDQEQRNKAARASVPCHPAAPNGFACLLIALRSPMADASGAWACTVAWYYSTWSCFCIIVFMVRVFPPHELLMRFFGTSGVK